MKGLMLGAYYTSGSADKLGLQEFSANILHQEGTSADGPKSTVNDFGFAFSKGTVLVF